MRQLVLLLSLLIVSARAQAPFESLLLLNSAATPGAPYFQYNIATATLDTGDSSSTTVSIAQRITIATNGVATKLQVHSSLCGGGNVKIGLYDASMALLASGTSAVPNDAAAHDLEVTISGVSVTAATDYWIGFIADTGGACNWKYKAAVGNRKYKSPTTYAAFPTDPYGETGSDTVAERVGIFVTP